MLHRQLLPLILAALLSLPACATLAQDRAETATVTTTWQDWLRQAPAIAAGTALEYNLANSNATVVLAPPDNQFNVLMDTYPELPAACNAARSYAVALENAADTLNAALAKRIAPDTPFDGGMITPISDLWPDIAPQDMPLVRIIAEINRLALEIHTRAEPYFDCDPLLLRISGPVTKLLRDRLLVEFTLASIDGINAREPFDPDGKIGDVLANERFARCENLRGSRAAFIAELAGPDVELDGSTRAGLDQIIRNAADALPTFSDVLRYGRHYGSEAELQISCAYLDIYQASWPSMRIDTSVVARLNLEDADLQSLQIADSMLTGPVDLDRARVAADVILTDLRGGGRTDPGSITARDAEIGGSLTMNVVAISNSLDLTNLSAQDVTLDAISDAAGNARLVIDASGASVAGELVLRNASGLADVTFTRAGIGVLHLETVTAHGTLDFDGLQADTLFVSGSRFDDGMTGRYATAAAAEFTGIQTSSFEGAYADFTTSLLIENAAFSKTLALSQISAGDVRLACIRTDEDITLDLADVVRGIQIDGTRSHEITLESAQVRELSIYAYNDTADATATEVRNALTGACTVVASADIITLANAQIDGVELTGAINDTLNLNGLTARRVMLREERLVLGQGAMILARNASLDVLAIADTALAPVGGQSIALDLDGATIAVIKPYSPILDEGDVEAMSRTVTLADVDEARLRVFYLDRLLPALTAPIDFSDDTTSRVFKRGYNASAYYTLRDSAAAVGYPAIERALAIAQNRHYQGLLGPEQWDMQLAYSLGGFISDYGYNNVKPIIYLLVLWIAGLLVINWDYARWAAAWTRWYQTPPMARLTTRPALQPGFLRGAFRSIDRTIPNLGLDNEFSTTTGLTPFQAGCLYIQRILAFVVLLFMLGGVFNFFQ